jgi:murein DD-endopeptidase MepM/ murein hydrolase activator NlpD
MLFATDIVKIRNSESNYLPPDNNDYPIFGENIFSPLSGEVVRVENGIKDNVPYSGNYPYNTGNTIVIRQGINYLLLGHLKMDSIRVKKGDAIHANDLIAEAGNSGYSERPHLHMQLINSMTDNYWTGRGVSMEYKRKNLYKNRLINLESENKLTPHSHSLLRKEGDSGSAKFTTSP